MDYRARFYHPVLARFIQPDSLIPDPSNPQAFNRYSYVNNSPINYTDPSGHCAKARYSKAVISDDECEERPVSSSGNSNDNDLDFTGYSDWEKEALQELYDNGGPNAVHGVNYILEHGIHITKGTGWQSSGGGVGAWFDEGSNTLIINSESSGNFDSDGDLSLWGLSLIIHEARHLEQGSDLSHSKLGEMDAWQIQIDVLANLGYFSLGPSGQPLLDPWAQSVMDAETVADFSAAVQNMNLPEKNPYWNHLYGTSLENYLCIGLCSYPDMPNYCMSIGTCPPVAPWWLRLNFAP
jgi:hypothetical protein